MYVRKLKHKQMRGMNYELADRQKNKAIGGTGFPFKGHPACII
jgi:hypothetical protein